MGASMISTEPTVNSWMAARATACCTIKEIMTPTTAEMNSGTPTIRARRVRWPPAKAWKVAVVSPALCASAWRNPAASSGRAKARSHPRAATTRTALLPASPKP